MNAEEAKIILGPVKGSRQSAAPPEFGSLSLIASFIEVRERDD
jgi:hypothetical protein